MDGMIGMEYCSQRGGSYTAVCVWEVVFVNSVRKWKASSLCVSVDWECRHGSEGDQMRFEAPSSARAVAM